MTRRPLHGSILSAFGALGVLAAGLCAPVALAEPTAAEAATARSLFDDARKLMKAGKYAEACPKLEEGARLNPGIGMRFNLASCWEHLGKTASAWSLYLDVAGAAKLANQPAREKEARKAAQALEPLLSQLTVIVPEKVKGLEIKRDGTVLGEGAYGTAVYVDPGTHVIEATAPDHEPWTQKAEIASKDKLTVTVPKLREIPKPVPPPPPPPPAPPGLGVARWTALGLGAVGVLGLGIGSWAGLRAMSLDDRSKAHCAGNVCDREGFDLRNDALGAGKLSTLGFAVGAVLVGSGAVLWFTAPARSDAPGNGAKDAAAVTPWVAKDGGGLAVTGAW